jgi:hypothetical protein
MFTSLDENILFKIVDEKLLLGQMTEEDKDKMFRKLPPIDNFIHKHRYFLSPQGFYPIDIEQLKNYVENYVSDEGKVAKGQSSPWGSIGKKNELLRQLYQGVADASKDKKWNVFKSNVEKFEMNPIRMYLNTIKHQISFVRNFLKDKEENHLEPYGIKVISRDSKEILHKFLDFYKKDNEVSMVIGCVNAPFRGLFINLTSENVLTGEYRNPNLNEGRDYIAACEGPHHDELTITLNEDELLGADCICDVTTHHFVESFSEWAKRNPTCEINIKDHTNSEHVSNFLYHNVSDKVSNVKLEIKFCKWNESLKAYKIS